MPTGVYRRSPELSAAQAASLALGRGWNKGKTYTKNANKPLPLVYKCRNCEKEFVVSKYNPRSIFCSRRCKAARLAVTLAEKYAADEGYRRYTRERNYKSKFGISISEYEEKLSAQKSRCAICGVHQDDVKRNFAVDHDHESGKVRDLLCAPCNTALGALKDSISLLEAAMSYLKRHK